MMSFKTKNGVCGDVYGEKNGIKKVVKLPPPPPKK